VGNINGQLKGMATWKEEIRRLVELKSTQIEDVLNKLKIPAVVTGGVIYPHQIDFRVSGRFKDPPGSLRSLESQIAGKMGVQQVDIVCREGGMVVSVMLNTGGSLVTPLMLLDLIASIDNVDPLTMILGALVDGRPITIGLYREDMSNILIVGSQGAGKTTLLRTMLYSLASQNKQHQFQTIVIDYDPRSGVGQADSSFAAFCHLPHLLEPVAITLDQAAHTLDRLINDLQTRLNEDIEQPKILVLIDNLDSLLADGQRSVTNRLLRLLQFGAEVGIHLVLALEEPVGEYIEQIMKCDFSQRLIGRVENEKLARAAAKISDTGAELLPGLGAFVGISGGRTFQIQTAYISDYDLYLAVEKLSRQIMRRMVARTAEFRVGFAQAGS
jgi:hypothetical protein